MPQGRPTQADVARAAGVSQTTVSIVLNQIDNGTVRLADATRARVLEALESTGYIVNPIARSLAGHRTNIFGVFGFEPVFGSDSDSFYLPFMEGIEQAAERAARDLLLFTSAARDGSRHHIYRQNENRLRLVDGCILIGNGEPQMELSRLASEGYPFVFIGRREIPGVELPYSTADYAGATRRVVERLADLGHTDVAYLATGMRVPSSIERQDAAQEEASRLGMRARVIEDAGAVDFDAGRCRAPRRRAGRARLPLPLAREHRRARGSGEHFPPPAVLVRLSPAQARDGPRRRRDAHRDARDAGQGRAHPGDPVRRSRRADRRPAQEHCGSKCMTTVSQSADVLVVGAGVGGLAATLAVLRRGLTVVLTEEYRWIGGQLTVQATPPDEHPWIEQFGASASYRGFRDALRGYYRTHFALSPRAQADPVLNPGNATVSKLAVEPVVSEAVLQELIAPWLASGKLTLHTSTRPVACETDGDRIGAVEFVDAAGDRFTVTAGYVIDATETGDLLELGGVEHVTGAEAQSDTGEPHAPAVAQPQNMQSFSWPFAVSYSADGGDHTIDRPASYDQFRSFRPPFWPADYLSLTYPDPRTLEVVRADFAPLTDGPEDVVVADQSKDPGSKNLWIYRRVRWRHNFRQPDGADGGADVSIINWPMTDYLGGNLFGVPAEEAAHHREQARQLSLSYLYWLQTEAPRPDGGTGWKGLRLAPESIGTDDGLAMGPYVRESRRIRALRTVVEQDLSLAVRGEAGAMNYPDSVGIGAYRIDLHPSTGGDNYIDVASSPFQIPLGALVPARVTNLIPGAKNLGTTHITSGCYRVHPAEWSIGEAAGALAAYCTLNRTTPHAVAGSAELTQASPSSNEWASPCSWCGARRPWCSS
jgi:DNA-binding LacI/PurR family transcriptional regulator